MRTAKNLEPDELAAIVAALQQALYRFRRQTCHVGNPDKEWNGAEIGHQMAAELARSDHFCTLTPIDSPAP